MNRSVFFTLFPIVYWLSILAGILLRLLGEGGKVPGNILINLGVFIIAIRMAMIIHESGHLIAARIVGGVPRRVVFGVGHEIYRTRIFNISVVVNSRMSGAFAGACFGNPNLLKLRYAFFVLGGVLLNLLVALTVYGLFGFSMHNSGGEIAVALPAMTILANSVTLLNLLPFNSSILNRPSDGLALLKLPFASRSEIRKHLDLDLIFDGLDFFERKEYQDAWKPFSEYKQKYPDSHVADLYLSVVLLKTGQPEKSLEMAESMLDHVDNKELKRHRGMIYNLLAWNHLVLDNIEQADHFSSLAIRAMPSQDGIRGTRGSVLVRRGLPDEGIRLLSHSMDFKFVDSTTLSKAIFLMLAWHLKGKSERCNTCKEFVEKNASKLEADDRILFERNLKIMDVQTTSLG